MFVIDYPFDRYLHRPNSFALYTANRIYDLVADNSGEMHMWIGALSPKKFSLGDDDILNTCLMKGELSPCDSMDACC